MRKKLIKSNGIRTANAADCLPKEEMDKLRAYFSSLDLTKKNNLRNVAMLNFNLNVGMRAGDLLSLPKDMIIKNDKVVDMIPLYEQKTHKKRIIYLNQSAKKAIQDYYDAFKDSLKHSYWLFPSRKHNQGTGHLEVTSYNTILRNAQRASGIDLAYTVSSHGARKYWGASLYEAGVPLEQIRSAFNHSKTEVTLAYIDVIKRSNKQVYYNIEI